MTCAVEPLYFFRLLLIDDERPCVGADYQTFDRLPRSHGRHRETRCRTRRPVFVDIDSGERLRVARLEVSAMAAARLISGRNSVSRMLDGRAEFWPGGRSSFTELSNGKLHPLGRRAFRPRSPKVL